MIYSASNTGVTLKSKFGVVQGHLKWCRSTDDVRLHIGSAIVSMTILYHFCRAVLRISAAYDVTRCLSVRPSVTFVYSVETKKHNLNF